MDINVKKELLYVLKKRNKQVKDIDWMALRLQSGREVEIIHLENFEKLDKVYTSGFGDADLLGVVVFKDGTWLERGEYDGSTWWEYKSTPDQKYWYNIDHWLDWCREKKEGVDE